MNKKFLLNKKFLMIAISIAVAVAVVIAVCIGMAMNSSGDSGTDSLGTEIGGQSTAFDENAPSETEPLSSDAPNDSESDFQKLTYAEYIALSGSEQEAYFNKFADIDAFFAWYNAAKEEWENSQSGSDIIIGDGTLDFDDIFGPMP